MNRIRAIIAASALALGASLALAAPAQAATDQPGPACGTWKFSQAVLPYPAPLVPGVGLSSTDGSTVTLKKPDNAEPASAAGVEFAAKDLEIDGPTVITVKVNTDDVANLASGAVRFFGYTDQNANTLTDGPDYQATADADGQTLTLNVTGPVGTLGLVYDASNATTGTVTFSDLKVGDLAGKFKACPKPQESPTAKPPTQKPTSPPAVAGPQETLPKTGPRSAILGGGAGVLVLLGLALYFLARERRKPTFRAG